MRKSNKEGIDVVTSGINRFLSEGYSNWSRENFKKLLSSIPELDEETLVKNWQKKGYVEFVNKDNIYIRVLKEIK